MLLSSYERRVGLKRFTAVFCVSAFVSSFLGAFMITKNHVSVGSSAGLFGLVVAYYLDYKNVTVKEWFVGITIVLLLIILLSWYSSSLYKEIFYKVDWASHLLGATSAAIYIRLFNKR